MTTNPKESKFHFVDKLGPDVFFKLLKDLSPIEVVNTCSTSKEMSRLCDENFYKKYLSENFNITSKTNSYTWKRVTNELSNLNIDQTIELVNNEIYKLANFDTYSDIDERIAEPGGGESLEWDINFDIDIHYIGYVFGINKIIVIYTIYDEQIDEIPSHPDNYLVQEFDLKIKPKLSIKSGISYRFVKIKKNIQKDEISNVMTEYIIKKYERPVFVMSVWQTFVGMTYEELFETYHPKQNRSRKRI